MSLRESFAEVAHHKVLLGKRQLDSPVLLQAGSCIQNREPDESPVGPVTRRVALCRSVEVDGGARLADVEVEHVDLAVVEVVVATGSGPRCCTRMFLGRD